jgi:hypothetical protein
LRNIEKRVGEKLKVKLDQGSKHKLLSPKGKSKLKESESNILKKEGSKLSISSGNSMAKIKKGSNEKGRLSTMNKNKQNLQ